MGSKITMFVNHFSTAIPLRGRPRMNAGDQFNVPK
jgi:hypothetical protein